MYKFRIFSGFDRVYGCKYVAVFFLSYLLIFSQLLRFLCWRVHFVYTTPVSLYTKWRSSADIKQILIHICLMIEWNLWFIAWNIDLRSYQATNVKTVVSGLCNLRFLRITFFLQNWRIDGCTHPWWVFFKWLAIISVYTKEVNYDI